MASRVYHKRLWRDLRLNSSNNFIKYVTCFHNHLHTGTTRSRGQRCIVLFVLNTPPDRSEPFEPYHAMSSSHLHIPLLPMLSIFDSLDTLHAKKTEPHIPEHSRDSREARRLEDQRRTLCLLVTTELKVLASLERQLGLGLALHALETEHHLLGRLCLLVEYGLSLTTVSGLLAVVTTLSLGEERGLACLVLCDLWLSV